MKNRLAAKMELKATTVKAHKRDISKRTKRGTIRKGQSERIVNVSAHSRKGWKGYGKGVRPDPRGANRRQKHRRSNHRRTIQRVKVLKPIVNYINSTLQAGKLNGRGFQSGAWQLISQMIAGVDQDGEQVLRHFIQRGGRYALRCV